MQVSKNGHHGFFAGVYTTPHPVVRMFVTCSLLAGHGVLRVACSCCVPLARTHLWPTMVKSSRPSPEEKASSDIDKKDGLNDVVCVIPVFL